MACVIASITFSVWIVATVGDEAACPCVDGAVRIRQLPFGEPRQVGNFLDRIGEGKQLGGRVEAVDRQRRTIRMVGQVEARDDAQTLRPQRPGPFEKADGIVKGVMRPPDTGGFRVDLEGGAMQAQIVAVVRPDHHAVAQQADRMAIGVFGGVHDVDPRHVTLVRQVQSPATGSMPRQPADDKRCRVATLWRRPSRQAKLHLYQADRFDFATSLHHAPAVNRALSLAALPAFGDVR